MDITKDELREMLIRAYQGTCHDTNTKGDIQNIDIGAIYEILSKFHFVNSRDKGTLIVTLIHSDSGVREFLIVCEIGKFNFLLAHWRAYDNSFGAEIIPVGFQPFLDWLYEKLKPLPEIKTTITEELIFNN